MNNMIPLLSSFRVQNVTSNDGLALLPKWRGGKGWLFVTISAGNPVQLGVNWRTFIPDPNNLSSILMFEKNLILDTNVLTGQYEFEAPAGDLDINFVLSVADSVSISNCYLLEVDK